MGIYNYFIFVIVTSGLLTEVCLVDVANNSKLEDTVLLAYDNNSTVDDNLYAIQSIFCPDSIFCPEDVGQKSEWITSVLTENSEAYEWMFGNKSMDVVEARRMLLTRFQPINGCCKMCSCEKNCDERNNCCPMSRFKMRKSVDEEKKSNVSQVCTHAIISRYVTPGYPIRNEFYGQSYYMVVDCFPPSFSDGQTRQKCQYPDNQFPDQKTPVYSSYTDRIYRNKYCAECNNDVNVTSWTLLLVLSSVFIRLTESTSYHMNGTSLYQSVAMNPKAGYIKFLPPEQLEIKEESPLCVIPFPGTDNRCRSKYLERNGSKLFLQSACSNFDHVFINYIGIYSNIFCHICEYELLPKAVCKSSLVQKSTIHGFTAILSLDDLTEPDESVEDSRTSYVNCGCRYYFNTRENSCRELLCPFGEFWSGCSCREFTKNISGLLTRVYTELNVMEPRDNEFTGNSSVEFVEALAKRVSRYFTANWKSIYITVFGVFRENKIVYKNQFKFHTVSQITVKYGYNGRKEMKNILDQLQKGTHILFRGTRLLLSHGSIYDIEKLNYTTKLRVSNNYDTTIEMNSTSLLQVNKQVARAIHSYGQSFVLNRLFFCTQINLNEDEADQLHELAKTKGYSPSQLTYIYRKENKRICIDDYVDIFSSACTVHMTGYQFIWLIVLVTVLY